MEKKEKIINIITAILCLTFVLVIMKFLLAGESYLLLWVCYITLFIIIIGLLKRNPYLILSQVIILLIPDLFWTFDFLYLVFAGHTLIDLALYFPAQTLLQKIVSLQHLYTVPLSIFAIYLMKMKKNYKVLLASLGEIVLIFFLTLLLVPEGKTDINCVRFTCLNINLNFLPYYLSWFLFAFGFAAISYFIMTSLPFLRKKESTKNKKRF
ncbi:MAG: hypothetical protein NTU63_00175 [Candidatus Pacearchaeota archaeon]|nr:hypothetical protein [Candidatus Pacearchaeota archaeon]